MADMQITEWGIEHNEQGHRANLTYIAMKQYVLSVDIKFPGTFLDYGKGTKTVALLKKIRKWALI